MKTSIPSEVWEKKKSLIAKLYKDEEWPLKQVIKQIRTEDFNPSETQLRSRLKKWRVTKPSRQTRKKPSSPPEMEDDDQPLSPVNPKPTVLPAPPATLHPQQPQLQPQLQSRPKPHLKALQTSLPGWYDANGPYQRLQSTTQQPVQPATRSFDRQELDSCSWDSPLEAQQVSSEPQDESNQLMSHFPSPSIPSVSTSAPYDLHSVITHSNGVTMTSAPLMTPTYSAVYDGSPETCLPSPASPTLPWPTITEPDVSRTILPIATWLSSSYEGPNSLATAPFYPAKTTSSPMASYGQMIQPMLAPDLSPVFSQSPPLPDAFAASLWDDGPILKPYRRAIGYHPQAAAGHVRVDRQGRQRKSLQKKRKETLLRTSPAAMVPLSQQF
jgi:hypothetical protein